MILTWRGAEYTFKQRAFYTSEESATRNSTIDELIFAFDTESCVTGERYEPLCFQLSGEQWRETLTYIPHEADALELFLTEFDDQFGLYISELNEKRPKVFLYAHDLAYDWLQLIKNYPILLQIARTGLSPENDFLIYDNGMYTATLKSSGLFVGNAPFFEIEIYHNKQVNYSIAFRDTFSFFPASLDSLGKELNLDEYKRERPENIGNVDYRNLSDSSPEKIEFELYAKVDAKVTRLVGERIRELHKSAGLEKIRVSAPSYAISYLLHSLSDIIPDKTKLLNGTSDPDIMQLVLNSYAGGRTGGIFHGEVNNITVLDIHSSYPASMATLPSFGNDMMYYDIPACELKTMTTDDLIDILNEYHGFINFDGEENDPLYPSVIQAANGKLFPVYGEFENLSSTGVEVYSGIMSGSLTVKKINKLVVLIDQPDAVLPFKIFAEHAYDRKRNSKKGSPEYTSAKLVLNSSYGKLIESRSDMFIDDKNSTILLPFVKTLEKKFAHLYYEKYIEMLKTERIDFVNYIGDTLTEIYEGFDEDDLSHTLLGNLSLVEKTFGKYAIPAAAALITGTSRARLVTGMKLLHALYWDTDSIFIQEEFDAEKINEILAESENILPAFIQPLKLGEELGDLDAEIENASGYLAGTKRYYLNNGKDEKRALHGMPSSDKREAEELIEKLATGTNATYTGRARPLKAKEAKNADAIGRFTRKEYTSVFELDSRLEWTETENGWSGKVRQFDQLKTS